MKEQTCLGRKFQIFLIMLILSFTEAVYPNTKGIETEIELRNEKRLFENEKNEYRKSEEILLNRKNEKLKQLETDREKLEKISSDYRQEKHKTAGLDNKLQNLKNEYSGFTGEIIERIDKMILLISDGIPFDIENRIASLLTLKSELSENIIGNYEALSRFLAFLDNEEKLSRTNGVWSEKTVINGEIRELRCIRIGMVTIAAEDNSGDGCYLLVKKDDGYTWKSLDNYQDRLSVRNAIKIVEGRKPPEFISFPVSVKSIPEKGGKK